MKDFINIQKTGTNIIDLSDNNMCTKFQANISIFCRAMVQNPCNGYDITFLKLDFFTF